MDSRVETILARAVTVHREGSLAAAAALYAEILETDPQHADSPHLLGVTETQLGPPLVRPGTRALARTSTGVQINHLGYPGSLGAAELDYIIADEFLIPEAQRADYSEHTALISPNVSGSAGSHVCGQQLRGAHVRKPVAHGGITRVVTHSLEDYERRALELALTPDRLRRLRSAFTRNARSSALFDTDRFRRRLEAAYIEMAQRTRRREPAGRFRLHR